jgi:hypothetical protein
MLLPPSRGAKRAGDDLSPKSKPDSARDWRKNRHGIPLVCRRTTTRNPAFVTDDQGVALFSHHRGTFFTGVALSSHPFGTFYGGGGTFCTLSRISNIKKDVKKRKTSRKPIINWRGGSRLSAAGVLVVDEGQYRCRDLRSPGMEGS